MEEITREVVAKTLCNKEGQPAVCKVNGVICGECSPRRECTECEAEVLAKILDAWEAEVSELQEKLAGLERACAMIKNDIAWPVEGENTWECNVCSESTALLACVNENGDTDYIKPKFCAACGAKVVEL
ncbi:MAG: hypothetical protein RR842_04080 [Gordonibacter sp.]|uniref:hypothetical protein n=1 Tax=Gordonibacter sp. TaxID=1968902 RepID=UPI002FCA781B